MNASAKSFASFNQRLDLQVHAFCFLALHEVHLIRTIIYLSLLCTAANAPAQVRELWRNTVTNVVTGVSPLGNFVIPTNHSLTIASVDHGGNTLVGGKAEWYTLDPPQPYVSGFAAKFDRSGNELWRFYVGTNAQLGVEGIETDLAGNVFIALKVDALVIQPHLVVLKLSPRGKELWRRIQPGSNELPASLGVDPAGDSFLSSFIYLQISPGNFSMDETVAKYNKNGGMLWRTLLPRRQYFGDGSYDKPTKALVPLEDGGVVVVGQTSESGFAARLDRRGHVTWFKDQNGPQGTLPRFAGALVSRDTILAASLDGSAVFTENGKVLGTSPAAGVVVGKASNGDFLLNYPGLITQLSSSRGDVRWTNNTHLFPPQAAAADSTGVLVVADFTYNRPGIAFLRLDRIGQQVWQSVPTNFPVLNSSPRFLIRAPDGTFRLVAELKPSGGYPLGVEVLSISADR